MTAEPTLWGHPLKLDDLATQTAEVLGLLEERPEGITPLEALNEVGCMRLAARIFDLKAKGYAIVADTVEVVARNGRKARVARYRLA